MRTAYPGPIDSRQKNAPLERRGVMPADSRRARREKDARGRIYEQVLPCDGWKPFAFASASDM